MLVNLAVSLTSRSGERVLVVDMNHEDPAIHRIFNLEPGQNIEKTLRHKTSLSQLVRATSIDNLFVLSALEMRRDPIFIFKEESGFRQLLEELKTHFGYVLFDSPPLGRNNFAARLGSLLDGVILVVETERVRWQVAQKSRDRLLQARADIMGVALNKKRYHVPKWLYKRL